MRKLFIFFSIITLLFSLVACGNEDISQETATLPTSSVTSPTQSNTTSPQWKPITLVDNDQITFRITAVTQDPIWGYTLKVFMENKTDLELMFTLESVSINGFMCDPFWAHTVPTGKKSNQGVSWLDSTLAENGIESVEQIEFTLRVFDNNDWLTEDIFSGTFTIEP